PTAGLHFTPDLIQAIDAKGIAMAEVTLHVGAGTFLPVKVDDIRDHVMHSEWGEISTDTAQCINATKEAGGRVVCVGTTSLRILESCWRDHGDIRAYQAETDLFIIPGFQFGVADMLLTNFHLPKSTLLMLISAFAGKNFVEKAYAHAIDQSYRFFSYGDACLMERAHD
ncbi:MAG: S-adenosylmethionine:tRNA ribosyltransferase-isomerase, partial [Alphaproteobacteria bacterium]